jgi:hypothetical protein
MGLGRVSPDSVEKWKSMSGNGVNRPSAATVRFDYSRSVAG